MPDSMEQPVQPGRCLNCGAALVGEYCSRCGQRAGREDIHFSDVAVDLAGDFVAWDSKIWRTLLPLLFRPGFLTAEYMAGRRARYVPPLRLYLIISFVLFLVLSLSAAFGFNGAISVVVDEDGQLAGRGSGRVSETIGLDLHSDDGDEAGPAREDSDSETIRINLAGEDSPAWLKAVEQRMEENAQSLHEAPEEFIAQILEYLPQMMFLLLPLFALLLRLCYLFSPYHYLQHLVFSLNYHSFVFLLYLIGLAAEQFDFHGDGLLFLFLLVYLPIGLWRAFGSGWAGALGKSLLIYFSYAILLAIAFAVESVLVLLLM